MHADLRSGVSGWPLFCQSTWCMYPKYQFWRSKHPHPGQNESPFPNQINTMTNYRVPSSTRQMSIYRGGLVQRVGEQSNKSTPIFARDDCYPSSVRHPPFDKPDFGLRFGRLGLTQLAALMLALRLTNVTFCTGMIISKFNPEDSHWLKFNRTGVESAKGAWRNREIQTETGGALTPLLLRSKLMLVGWFNKMRKCSRKPGNLPDV